MNSIGLPHSDISGSMDICSSPKLIAACHVLHRLLMPRHSPCALYSLTLRDILVLLFGIMQAINRLLSQNCNCYPHLFRCSTIKIHNSFQLPLKPSVALLSSHFNTLFSFQGSIFQLLLQPDLKICLTPGLQIQQQLLFGGPEWARTTDLTIISRTL